MPLIEPEMKITGSATPKAILAMRFPADRSAGDWTSWPTKAYNNAPVRV